MLTPENILQVLCDYRVWIDAFEQSTQMNSSESHLTLSDISHAMSYDTRTEVESLSSQVSDILATLNRDNQLLIAEIENIKKFVKYDVKRKKV
jgi:hypothetical protein